MKPPAAFRLSPQSLAIVIQYSQLIGCTPPAFPAPHIIAHRYHYQHAGLNPELGRGLA
jgi:hypothetical protein